MAAQIHSRISICVECGQEPLQRVPASNGEVSLESRPQQLPLGDVWIVLLTLQLVAIAPNDFLKLQTNQKNGDQN